MSHTGFGVFVKVKSIDECAKIEKHIEHILTKDRETNKIVFDYLEIGEIILKSESIERWNQEVKDILSGCKNYGRYGNFAFDAEGKEHYKIKDVKELAEESNCLLLGDGHE